MAITAFRVLSAPSIETLAQLVRAYITDGWQPYAGPVDGASLYQTVVKTDPVPTNPYVTYDICASTTPAGVESEVLAWTANVEHSELFGPLLHADGLFLQAVVATTGVTNNTGS